MKKKNKELFRPSSELIFIFNILKKSKSSIIGIIIILLFIFIAVFHKSLAPNPPLELNLNSRFIKPNKEFPLGTDEFGRCILSRILYGSAISLKISIITVFVSMSFGIIIGAISGYYSGKIDFIIMRIVDILLSFPTLILSLGVLSILGPGIEKLVFVLALLFWTRYARVVRSQVLSIKTMEYIEASKVFGASNFRIIFDQILPNTLSSSIVLATFQLGTAILTEASLSFLGLGVPPPAPSWGNMLSHSRGYLLTQPYLSLIPGLCITIVILGFNLLGDGLRDAFDPRLRI